MGRATGLEEWNVKGLLCHPVFRSHSTEWQGMLWNVDYIKQNGKQTSMYDPDINEPPCAYVFYHFEGLSTRLDWAMTR